MGGPLILRRQPGPRFWPNNPVGGQPIGLLERDHSRLGLWPEGVVQPAGVVAVAVQQTLNQVDDAPATALLDAATGRFGLGAEYTVYSKVAVIQVVEQRLELFDSCLAGDRAIDSLPSTSTARYHFLQPVTER